MSFTASAANPVSAKLYAVLVAFAGLTALVSRRVYPDVPQAPTYPFVLYEIVGEVDRRGFGEGGLPELELRTHAYSTAASPEQAHEVNRQVVLALKDIELTNIEGYAMCGRIFYDESLNILDELNGVKVHECISHFRVFVEDFNQ